VISVARLFNYSQVTPIRGKQITDLQGIIIVFAIKLLESMVRISQKEDSCLKHKPKEPGKRKSD